MSPYVRKVPTASGATAVQIVEKRNGRRRIVEHIGSARDETELAALMSAAQQRVNGVQDDMLPFGASQRAASGPVVEHTASEVLWRVLATAYRQLGFDQIEDEVFTSLVAARVVEPTSKLTPSGCWASPPTRPCTQAARAATFPRLRRREPPLRLICGEPVNGRWW